LPRPIRALGGQELLVRRHEERRTERPRRKRGKRLRIVVTISSMQKDLLASNAP